MHRRLYAPLGRLLLALVALTTVAALSACSESDNRPLVVVHDPVTPVTSPANVGRVDVKVTTPNGDVTHSFTAEEVAKGDLGVYLPAGTTGTVTVVVIIYGKDGAIIATSPQVAVTVAPGKVQTTSVWQSTGDRDASTPIGPDGPLSGLDAGIDSPRTGDAVIGEVGVDIGGGVVVSDGSVDAIVSDVPLSPDGPLPVDTGLPRLEWTPRRILPPRCRYGTWPRTSRKIRSTSPTTQWSQWIPTARTPTSVGPRAPR